MLNCHKNTHIHVHTTVAERAILHERSKNGGKNTPKMLCDTLTACL